MEEEEEEEERLLGSGWSAGGERDLPQLLS